VVKARVNTDLLPTLSKEPLREKETLSGYPDGHRRAYTGLQRGNMVGWLPYHSKVILIAWNVSGSMFCELRRSI
jgi:hypothetical protein